MSQALPWMQNQKGEHIAALQTLLNRNGANLIMDGEFGPDTFTALIEFQTTNNLIPDGVAGVKTLCVLRGESSTIFIGEQDIRQAAKKLGTDYAAVMAVYKIESNGRGLDDSSRAVILYERHIMARQLKAHGLNVAGVSALCERYPNLINKTPGGYGNGNTEHYRLSLAKTIHSIAALESCSWGLFQIMGHHWDNLKYSSIQDFVANMNAGEPQQLDVFTRFILANKTLHKAIKQKNWTAFAKAYNGPAYKKNHYHSRLKEQYKYFSKNQPTN